MPRMTRASAPSLTVLCLVLALAACGPSTETVKVSGTPAGALKFADPSVSTGTVPRTCLPGAPRARPTGGRSIPGVDLGSTWITRSRVIRSSPSGGSLSWTF